MAHIVRLETTPFELAMKGALRWGKNSKLTSLKHVLVKVCSSDGIFGIAEAPVRTTIYGETVESVEAIVSFFSQDLIGLDSDDSEAIANVLDRVKNNQCAKGAIDIALHMLRAKLQNKNIVEAYAGPNKSIRVSYILGISDANTMLAEARRVFEAGVSVFKIKIGRDSQHDREIVEILQSEFKGTEVLLYADANEALSPKEAPKRLEMLAQLGVQYIEEPLPVHLIKERAALKALNILPIIADDSCFSSKGLARELDFDTFDILNIKTARTGFSKSFAMLQSAKKASKGIMLGSQASAGLGTAHCAIMASQMGVNYPSELSFPLKLQKDILKNPIVYKDGYLHIDDLRSIEINL